MANILIDGNRFTVPDGISIAAALMHSDVVAWRSTRLNAKPRGIFCGIGACFDCLVTVNGQSAVRACIDTVRDGDSITTDIGGEVHDAR